MVHFSSILSSHLAFVARNDPLTSAASLADDYLQPPDTPILLQFEQPPAKAGLLVTGELRAGIARVKKNVVAIAQACRRRNSKFRDIEFDLEEDREKCLHGLDTKEADKSNPSDVQRVTQVFREPQFFIDGPSSTDVVQGVLGDCWFLSGVAAVATVPELVENFCVARDEEVGVYGFMFQRNGIWTDVIIDDLLYTSIPKYEELTIKEQQLYHEDKDRYNGIARLGSKALYFAKSGSTSETWVPLLEKAYAKLHGDYASLAGGHVGEAMEDLTGGVSTVIHLNDILDKEVFWKNELLRVNKDRLFGCSIYDLRLGSSTYPTDPGYGPPTKTVNGLYTAHAYSIIKAVEFKGKRFLRIRNPWGNSEWTGRWSDGSKEWTPVWITALEHLGHSFGDDGAFVMEYEDFLNTWTLVHRTRLFDPSWAVSSLWMNAKIRLPGMVWDYGDISFTFTLPSSTPAIIVLSKLDDRYARGLLDRMRFSLDFQLYKKGGVEPILASTHSIFNLRSVNAEADLDAGEYVVHVRVDSEIIRGAEYLAQNIPRWSTRKIGQVLALASETSSILANFAAEAHDNWLRRPSRMWAGRDLQEIQTVVDVMNAAPPTPLPYPPVRSPPGPPPVSALSGTSSSEPSAVSDNGSDDDDDDEEEDDDEQTIYDIPGFPLRSSSTSVVQREPKLQPNVHSPQIVPTGLDARVILSAQADALMQEGGSIAHRLAKAASTRDRLPPISVRREIPPTRSSTAEVSNAPSNASSNFLNPNTSQNATARLMMNPEIHATDDPEIAVGLRVFTKNYGAVEIKGQIRQGKLYPWKGV